METLNIRSDSDDLRARELSNLQPRPFILDEVKLRSAEGFIQGIKYPLGDPLRLEVFNLAGIKAKRMGEQAGKKYVWWNYIQIPYGSTPHHALIEKGIRESFKQNPYALILLYSTRGMKLTHDLGTPESPNTSLPADDFCDILTRLRDEGDSLEQRRLAEQLGFVPELNLASAQEAAKLIEIAGGGAYPSVSRIFGREAAFLLLVSHIRRACGSMDRYPANQGIETRVTGMFEELNIRSS
ncbi:MAG: hypothetical protein WC477_02265 [Patescibacteria group bacterium]